MRLRSLLRAAVFPAALLFTSPAVADPSAADKALAESLFRDAKALMQKGNLEQACPKYAESQRLDPAPGTLYNLGLCHEKQGKTASAWADFNEAASLYHNEGRTDREKMARDQAKGVEKSLSFVVLSVDPSAGQASVQIDGKTLSSAVIGSSLPLDPGEHALSASSPGKVDWTKTLVVPSGPSKTEVLVYEGGAAPAPPASTAAPTTSTVPPPPPPDTGASTRRTIGWIVGGVGVAGLAVGSVFGLQAFSKKNSGDSACSAQLLTPPCSLGGSNYNDASSAATLSTVSFIAGGVAVAVGVVLILTSSGSRSSALQQMRILPQVGKDGAFLTGSF